MKRDLAWIAGHTALLAGLLALWLCGLIVFKPGEGASEFLALEGSIYLLAAGSVTGAVLAGIARQPILVAALAFAAAIALMVLASLLNALLHPEAYDAAGPAAMALMLPVLVSLLALGAALALRGLWWLIRGRRKS